MNLLDLLGLLFIIAFVIVVAVTVADAIRQWCAEQDEAEARQARREAMKGNQP